MEIFNGLCSQKLKLNILETASNSPVGYLLEINLDYPKELHNQHYDLQMCPEHIKITYKISLHSKKLCDF